MDSRDWQDYWDRVAGLGEGDWDTVGTNDAFFRYYRRLVRRGVLREIEQYAGKTILEVGCGMGKWSFFFAQSGAHVLATDISPSMIEVARREAKRLGLTDRIEFQVLDITQQRPPGNYDIVFGAAVLQHIYDDAAFRCAVANIAEALVAGGRAVFAETAPHAAMSRLLQALADRTKGVKDCSYRSFGQFVRTFEGAGCRLLKYRGLDISYPITYTRRTLGFRLSGKNWLSYSFPPSERDEDSWLDQIIAGGCWSLDALANLPAVRELSLFKVMTFVKDR